MKYLCWFSIHLINLNFLWIHKHINQPCPMEYYYMGSKANLINHIISYNSVNKVKGYPQVKYGDRMLSISKLPHGSLIFLLKYLLKISIPKDELTNRYIYSSIQHKAIFEILLLITILS